MAVFSRLLAPVGAPIAGLKWAGQALTPMRAAFRAPLRHWKSVEVRALPLSLLGASGPDLQLFFAVICCDFQISLCCQGLLARIAPQQTAPTRQGLAALRLKQNSPGGIRTCDQSINSRPLYR
ncbi:MAG: hypothetical protein RLZZ263_577 [Cyanobacteriota bacterium]